MLWCYGIRGGRSDTRDKKYTKYDRIMVLVIRADGMDRYNHAVVIFIFPLRRYLWCFTLWM